MQAVKGENEEERLAALYRYNILDTPVEEAFEGITRLISYICKAPVAVVSLVDRDRQFFKSETGLGVRETPLDISVCAHAILQPGLFIVPDTLADSRFADNPLVTGDPRLRFYAGALLETSDGHALGTLCVLDYTPRELSPEQQDALTTLAAQVMSLIELRQLYEHQKDISTQLQNAVIPALPGDPPGLDLAAYYKPAIEELSIGGDFYDVYEVGSNCTALVVADLSGKGLPAASQVATVRNMLRAVLYPALTAAGATSALNEMLVEHNLIAGFATLFLGLFDSNNRTLTYVSCGQEPGLLLRSATGRIEELPPTGPVLGGYSDAAFTESVVKLEPGDIFALFTDGLTEAGPNRTDLLEVEGVSALLAAALPGDDAAAVSSRLISGVNAFAKGGLRDDVCLLVGVVK